jgi:hypothetical protein
MGLSVTLVSGPRSCGKSVIIQGMINHLWKREPHYIRLALAGSDKLRPKAASRRPPECGVKTARWLEYSPERIFEVLPEALTAIHKKDRYGTVVLEADADPIVRHAYPYDHRIFVMPLPESTQIVFRDSHRAAKELQRVLDDTVAFASEMFGLITKGTCGDAEPHEPRPDLSDSQMRGFLYSPLGDELATRIQLQPAYHGLVESDIVVVNDWLGTRSPETDICLQRVERLLERVRGLSGRSTEFLLCKPRDDDGQICKKLLKALEAIYQPGA